MGAAVYHYSSYSVVFYITGAVVFVMAPIPLYVLPHVEDIAKDRISFLPALALWPVLLVALVGMVGVIGLSGMDPVLAVHLQTSYGLDQLTIALFFVALALSYVLVSPLVAWMGGRIGNLICMVIGMVGLAVAYLFLGPSPLIKTYFHLHFTVVCVPLSDGNLTKCVFLHQSEASTLAAIIALGFSAAAVIIPAPIYMTNVADSIFGEHNTPEIVSSIINLSFNCGMVLGPMITSTILYLDSSFAWMTTYVAGGLFVAVVAVSAVWYGSQEVMDDQPCCADWFRCCSGSRRGHDGSYYNSGRKNKYFGRYSERDTVVYIHIYIYIHKKYMCVCVLPKRKNHT